MTDVLSRLTYRSSSLLAGTRSECNTQIAAILDASRINNLKAGLTGILLFDGNSFLQVIEGQIAHVERLYEIIACDNRHEELEIIDLVEIDERDYEDWEMAYIDGSDLAHGPLRRFLSSKTDRSRTTLGSELSAAMKTTLLTA